MTNKVGRSLDSSSTLWIKDDRYVGFKKLSKGNIENEYEFRRTCRYFFEYNPTHALPQPQNRFGDDLREGDEERPHQTQSLRQHWKPALSLYHRHWLWRICVLVWNEERAKWVRMYLRQKAEDHRLAEIEKTFGLKRTASIPMTIADLRDRRNRDQWFRRTANKAI